MYYCWITNIINYIIIIIPGQTAEVVLILTWLDPKSEIARADVGSVENSLMKILMAGKSEESRCQQCYLEM